MTGSNAQTRTQQPSPARAGRADLRGEGRRSASEAPAGAADAWLWAILACAAALRLSGLTLAPPGINQDEALSAWNGWCLLNTGHAMSGEPWPIFYTRNIGDYPTTLFFYVLVPFLKFFGLSVLSARLPVALAGVAATALAWDLGRRLGGVTAGRWAGLAMAVAPWSVFLGHFGTGASLGPLQALLPLWLLVHSGLAPALGPGRSRYGWAWALAAGLAFGVGTYGFHSLKLQLPLTLAAALLVSPRSLRRALSEPSTRVSLVALLVGFLGPFLPLAYVTLSDTNSLRRWEMTRLWAPGAPWSIVLQLVTERWAIHFSPDFLFARGDRYSMLNPARMGALPWWMLPGLVTGIALMLWRVLSDAKARLLLLLLALYPVGDLVSANDGVHSLRSAAGLPALALVVGFGTHELLARLHDRRQLLRVATVALGLVAASECARFGVRFFRDAVRDRTTQIEYQAALLEAGRWLALRMGRDDAVFCTTTGMNEPFVILLVGLRYDAARWLAAEKELIPGPFDRYRRFGRFDFIYDDTAQARMQVMRDDGRPERVWFVVRPGEFSLTAPEARFRAPDGEEMLWVCARTL
jgi:4-amino-4-deoxy-L-arabinose transferase-like glycosyltransferase